MFTSLDTKSLPKIGLLLKERIVSLSGADSFLSELAFISKGGKNGNDRVALPKSVPTHLNIKLRSDFVYFLKNALPKSVPIHLNIKLRSDFVYF